MTTRARAATLLAGAASFAWAATTAAPARAQTLLPLRVINPPIEAAAENFCAQDMGFYAKAGFDVTIQIMQAGVPAAVASSAFEFGWVTVDALSNAHAKGIPLVAIAPSSEYNFSPKARPDSAILVSATSALREPKDLNGKVVAVPSRLGISENSTRAWIDANGGDSTTVKIVEIPFVAMAAALDAGRVDAAYVTEPFLTAIGNHERNIGNPVWAVGKHYLNSAWATTQQYARDHPDVVSHFVGVMRQTATWVNRNPLKSGEIVAKYTKIDPATIASMVRSHFGDQLTAALLQPVLDLSARYNKFPTYSAQELIYTR